MFRRRRRETTDKGDGVEGSTKRRIARRAFRRRLSVWEKVLLGFLGLVILFCFARPIYERWAKFRTARARKKIARLRESPYATDWAKLLVLASFSATKDLPGETIFWINPDEARMHAYTEEIRRLARGALDEAVFRNTTNTLTALTSEIRPVREYALGRLHAAEWWRIHRGGTGSLPTGPGAVWRQSPYPEPPPDRDWEREFAEAALGGNAKVREFLLEGSQGPGPPAPRRWPDRPVRSRIVRTMVSVDADGAFPFVEAFLLNVLGTPDTLEDHEPLEFLVGWYLSRAKAEHRSQAEQILRGCLANFAYDPARISPILHLARPRSYVILGEFLAGADSAQRVSLIQWATREDAGWPPEIWIGVLDDRDLRVRILAARLLGYHKVAKAAGALGKLLEDPSVEVRLQAAWSLAVLGDKRGREALARWIEDGNSEPCEDLHEIFQVWLARGTGIMPAPVRGRVPGTPLPAAQTLGEYARGVLKHVDRGGTIPLSVAPWPRPDPGNISPALR